MTENNEHVSIRDVDGVRHVTLNRPEKANALCISMIQALRSAIESGAAAGMRMVVLCSASQKLFCSGADIEEFLAGPDKLAQQSKALRELIGAMAHCPLPLLALARGKAAGAGVIVLSLMDIVVAADNLVFVCPEIEFGMYPGVVQAVLEVKTGQARARQLCLSGEALRAAEAKQAGLVTDVFPADVFEIEAHKRLAYFAARSEALLMARKAWLLSGQTDAIMHNIGMLEPLLHENFSHSGVSDAIKSYFAQLRTRTAG